MKWRSIGAVVAGIGANFLAALVDWPLHALGVLPAPDEPSGEGPLALALAYRAGFAVLGGYVVAKLAPSSPMGHAWVLGGLGIVLSTLGAAAQWGLGHHWYPLCLIALCVPATWIGARLAVGRAA